jgi:hypothetical protein
MRTILCIGLMAVAPAVWAQEFPTTPKTETLQEAVRFQKSKDAADEAQARKEAGEQARASGTPSRRSKVTAAKTDRSNTGHQTGQSDSSKK